MKALWALCGVTLEDAVAEALDAGLIQHAPDQREWERLRAESWSMEEIGVAAFSACLHDQRALCVYDAEGSYRPQHDRLVLRLAEATRGRLSPEAVLQEGSPEGLEHGAPAYRLSLVVRGRC